MGRRHTGRPLAAVALVAVLALAGASPASSAGGRVHDAKYGFTFNLPAHWQSVPLSGGDVSGLLNLITKADPSMKAALSAQVTQAAKSGFRFFALGPIRNKFAPNINIIVEPVNGLPTGTSYYNEMGVEVKLNLVSAGLKNVRTGTVALSLGKVVEATYSLKTKLSASTAFGVQFYLPHKGHLFIVTFTSWSLATARSDSLTVGNSWGWS